jgi:hypothetical protein
MAKALLGPGVSLVSGSAVYAGAANASGFFDADTNIFGPPAGAKGVLLTSGSVANALPPNNSPGASADNGLPGSAQLDSLVGGGTLDASRLDFKVKLDPGTSGIQWKYVFASEEYEEFVNTVFNDAFSLSVNGTNIAFIPGTTTPVSVNTVNQLTNSSFYNSNFPPNSSPQPVPDTQYDGFTIPLTATATGLVPGQTYSLTFMVTDTGDSSLDSAVFLAGNSVSFPGGSPENPLIPPPPASPQEPWVFPPILVTPGQTFWFDPLVSIGYIINIASSSAPTLFDSFTAPVLPFNGVSSPYQLYSDGGACSSNADNYTTLIGSATPGVLFDFSTNLTCFAIKGISEENLLDPINTNAFIWGASFTDPATINVTQLPITKDYNPSTSSVPAPLPILGGAAVLGSLRRLRSLSSVLKAN